MNSSLDHSEIDELSKTEDDFESLWIEIKNNEKKNIICGCTYICMTATNEVFLMGDFNIDLLQYDSSYYL